MPWKVPSNVNKMNLNGENDPRMRAENISRNDAVLADIILADEFIFKVVMLELVFVYSYVS